MDTNEIVKKAEEERKTSEKEELDNTAFRKKKEAEKAQQDKEMME